MNIPVKMVNDEIQTTTFPIEYTVEPKKLYDGSIKIHISEIDNEKQTLPIGLVVNDKYNISTVHNNPMTISINDGIYAPAQIIPTESV